MRYVLFFVCLSIAVALIFLIATLALAMDNCESTGILIGYIVAIALIWACFLVCEYRVRRDAADKSDRGSEPPLWDESLAI